MASDIDRIRNEVSLPDLAASYGVRLEKDGYEFLGCCPFHSEDTPSFTIFAGKDDKVQRFHCFGCGERGDALDFVQGIKGVNLKEAIAILGGKAAGPNIAPKQVESRDAYEGIEPLQPRQPIAVGVKVSIYNPKRAGSDREWGSFAPSMAFCYRRPNGATIGYVLRHEMSDGKKETPMVMWVRLPNGKECWARFPFPKPRPLYGLETLGDARQVIVVEGEKCRDKLAHASGCVVVAWPGGTQGVKHCDWTPLAGRNIVMWGDADRPHPETGAIVGKQTADEIGAILAPMGCTYRTLDVWSRG